MTILDRIVADVRARLDVRKRTVSRSTLEAAPFFAAPTRSLAGALRGDALAILAECKKASPSKGTIRNDFDVADLAQRYARAGAAAISVLTEPDHFQGHLDFLAAARRVVDVPLLRKDFIVDPYQLVEARAYGADAVLLIAAVLEAEQLRDLHAAADALGLDCLVEVYDPAELDRIDFGQVRILGVNNRDLRTFEVDVEHSLRVFERVPAHVVRVSESGLRTARELAHLRRHGVDAVLIGETFMRAADPGAALARLAAAVDDELLSQRAS
ncbi:MAG: indole-3-glycerol phosphate synthase TrpC [Rhodothermales bacterium]|nr:indole-3-glycerol phosphate synthase TrpC [Rhodothermales bacterium]